MQSTNEKKCRKVPNRIVQESADQKRIHKCRRNIKNVLEEREAKYIKKLIEKCDTGQVTRRTGNRSIDLDYDMRKKGD